jgi:aspartate/glutamate/glutamine transport system substrate-binding protein
MKTPCIALAVLAIGLTGPAHAQMTAAVSQAQAASADLPQGSPTIENIKKRGKLLVGNKFGFPTFNFRNAATGRNEGYMADLARALAKRMLGDENKVEFRQTTDETRFDMLARNDIDVIIDLTPTSEEKMQQADFSDEIFRSGSGLLVKKGSPIKGVENLRKGTRVLYVTENKDVNDLKAKAPDATYIGFPDSKQAFAALKAGKGDVFTQVVTHLYRAASQDPDYVVVNRFTDKPYLIAVKKGDTVMRDYVNEFLRSIKASGEYDRLFQKWFAPYGGLAAK